MNGQILLALPRPAHAALWKHLVPESQLVEEAAFAYAVRETSDGAEVFRCIEWAPVAPDGFVSRSAFHLELTDAVRAAAIKHAHDLGVSLVELHSHTGRWAAAFSGSDVAGFREFVPHVWWRLKGRPYVAVVVAPSGFDGFAWLVGPSQPQPLNGVMVEHEVLRSTGLSRWDTEPESD